MRTRYPNSAPYREEIEPMHDISASSSMGGDPDYGLPPERWLDEGSEDFSHAGEGGGHRVTRDWARGGRSRYRDEEPARSSEHHGANPYERDMSEREGGRRGINSDRLRSSSRPGHWGDDRRASSDTPWWTQGYRDNPSDRDWDDVPRDRKGPRGYNRSDERIREYICERLARHHVLEVSDVEVSVQQGHVSLDGTVPERYMKHIIEDTADGCWGVSDVDNRIRVAPRPGAIAASAPRGDALESERNQAAPKPRGPSSIERKEDSGNG